MAVKSLRIDSLELDLENPRITLATDQRDAMQKILKEQGAKLINLAESISKDGFSPMDRCLILRSPHPGKFIALEGNRRVLAAKLLSNPSLIETLEMSEAFKKRLHHAAKSFAARKIEKLDCFEVESREEGNEWIRRRHTGEDDGRGIVRWSNIAGERFDKRGPALQALDFVMAHGSLTAAEKEKIEDKFPLTTLDRLLSTPSVRTAIGFEIDGGKLKTALPPDEALKPLKRIVLDLVMKVLTVTQLKSKEQQNKYIGAMKPADRPNLSKQTGPPAAIEGMSDQDFKPKSGAASKPSRPMRPVPRTTVVPKAAKLNVSNAKVQEIYNELRGLQLTRHPHAIAVLLRVFLETSVDHYLTVQGISLHFPTPGGNKDKSLKKKVEETIDHFIAAGAPKKDFIGINKAMNDVQHPFSPDILHAYVHNRFYTPVERDLTAAWDNGMPLFEKIWP